MSAKKITIRVYHLNKLKDESVWADILEMVTPDGCGQHVFKNVHDVTMGLPKPKVSTYYTKLGRDYNIKLRILYVDGVAASWAAVIINENQLWAYTKPMFRRQGLQRILMSKIARIYKRYMTYQTLWDFQESTFAYYDREFNNKKRKAA